MLTKNIVEPVEFIKQNIQLYPTALRLDVIFGSTKYLASVLDNSQYFVNGAVDLKRIDEVENNASVESCDGAVWEYMVESPESDSSDAQDEADKYKIIMWVKDSNAIPTIMHELIHVTWAVHKYSGIKMDVDSQEFQAYMMSYLTHEILNLIFSEN